jgi:hypothetical protein
MAAQDRERVLQAQGFPAYRYQIRQAREKLSCRRLPHRCHRMVDFMSLDPSFGEGLRLHLQKAWFAMARTG